MIRAHPDESRFHVLIESLDVLHHFLVETEPHSMLIAKRIYGLRSLQVGMGIAGAVLLYWCWLALFNLSMPAGSLNWSRYAVYCLMLVLGLIIDFFRAARWIPPEPGTSSAYRQACTMAAIQVMTAATLLFVFLFLARDQSLSRAFFLSYLVVLVVMLSWMNLVLPRWLALRLFRGRHRQRTLIAGNRKSIERLQPWIERKATYGICPLGLLADDLELGESVSGIPCVGSLRDASGIIEREHASLFILLQIPQMSDELKVVRRACDAAGTRLVLACDLGDSLCNKASFFSDDGVHLLSLREEPLESPSNRFLKRMLDVAVSLFVVTAILPWVSLVVWFLQRRQSPGPLFFRQVRTGLNNQEFIIYKFRTMKVDHGDQSRQATVGDDRIFPAGKWLRKSSIDELPQFINVLLGEMSVVGPRPHMPVHDEKFTDWDGRYRVRQMVKPGITGLAQVRGHRGETVTKKDIWVRTESDLQYLENWSLRMDVAIILLTALHVIKAPRTAH